jgi:hypothetical protein
MRKRPATMRKASWSAPDLWCYRIQLAAVNACGPGPWSKIGEKHQIFTNPFTIPWRHFHVPYTFEDCARQKN